MAHKSLARQWAGMDKAEITEGWTNREGIANFEDLMQTYRRELAVDALHAVAEKAEKGDLEAIMWLAIARGLIDLPGEQRGA